MANKEFSVEEIKEAILEGWGIEGFTNMGYLDKFAKGIAYGVHKKILEHSPLVSGKTYLNPNSVIVDP